jgi:two-component system, NtrC family, response regulator GlrR
MLGLPVSVLIVDDEEDILAALEASLRSRFAAVDVLAATTAEAALVALATRRFDVVLSDYRLRGPIDGATVLQRAARLQPWARCFCLAADPDPYLVQAGRELGFTVLAKPVDEALLGRLVGAHLKGAERQGPP